MRKREACYQENIFVCHWLETDKTWKNTYTYTQKKKKEKKRKEKPLPSHSIVRPIDTLKMCTYFPLDSTDKHQPACSLTMGSI